jgi:tetratricopeptide (TPR) repeat protein
VLTLERNWRVNFESAAQKGQEPKSTPEVLTSVEKLEKAVDEHANRFPGQSRSVDLILVAASANRDLNRFAEASRYWQRVLLSNPSQGQRAMAVRGLVFAKLRSGKPGDVIDSVSQFIKLEDNKTLGQNLRNELLGVLASAVTEESQRLSKAGSTDDAANLLLKMSADFPTIPGREQMWRDGAYFMAISGNWSAAQLSAESYLTDKQNQFAGDMTYLLARAQEYQMRFDQAVNHYLDLASKYPKHDRAVTAIDRAEKLATADENYVAAARATQLRADRAKPGLEKLGALDATIGYHLLSGDNAKAMGAAEERKLMSKSNREKLQAEITMAKVRYESGDHQTAIDDLDSIDKQLERAKYSLGDAYKRMSADVGLLLGEHAITSFRDQRFGDAKTDIGAQVDRKSRLFADIVARLDKVASLDQPEFSPKARFKIAQMASEFADEMTAIPAKAGEPVTLKSQTRFSQNIGRLRDLSQRYHGNNILAKKRSPQVYAKNEWISRSSMALSNASGHSSKNMGVTSSIDQLSTSSSLEMPQQWSH